MFVWVLMAALLVASVAALIAMTWSEDPPQPDPEPFPSNPHARVTAAFLRDVRLPSQGRGYHRGSVDVLLARAAEALEQAAATPAIVASGEEVEDGGRHEAGGLDR